MANTGKPKNVKMAKAAAPQMKTPTPNAGSRPSKAHPWGGGMSGGKVTTGGEPC